MLLSDLLVCGAQTHMQAKHPICNKIPKDCCLQLSEKAQQEGHVSHPGTRTQGLGSDFSLNFSYSIVSGLFL